MKRICKNCGTELPDGASRCVICGEEYTVDEKHISSNDDKGLSGGRRFPFKVIIISAALTIGAVGVFGVFNHNRQEEPIKAESVKEEPVKEEPVKEEPVKEETVEEETIKEEPIKEEPEEDEEPQEEHISPRFFPENYFVYNGHTYGFYDAASYRLDEYWDVVEFCREQGGYLAVINDQAENNKLFDFVSKNYERTAFFGYSDELHEGNWVWEEGGSHFENWTVIGQHQPDNGASYDGDEDYAEFNYERGTPSPNDGTWNDAQFRDNTDTFICEWEYEF